MLYSVGAYSELPYSAFTLASGGTTYSVTVAEQIATNADEGVTFLVYVSVSEVAKAAGVSTNISTLNVNVSEVAKASAAQTYTFIYPVNVAAAMAVFDAETVRMQFAGAINTTIQAAVQQTAISTYTTAINAVIKFAGTTAPTVDYQMALMAAIKNASSSTTAALISLDTNASMAASAVSNLSYYNYVAVAANLQASGVFDGGASLHYSVIPEVMKAQATALGGKGTSVDAAAVIKTSGTQGISLVIANNIFSTVATVGGYVTTRAYPMDQAESITASFALATQCTYFVNVATGVAVSSRFTIGQVLSASVFTILGASDRFVLNSLWYPFPDTPSGQWGTIGGGSFPTGGWSASGGEFTMPSGSWGPVSTN